MLVVHDLSQVGPELLSFCCFQRLLNYADSLSLNPFLVYPFRDGLLGNLKIP